MLRVALIDCLAASGINDTAFEWNKTIFGVEPVGEVAKLEKALNVSKSEAEIMVQKGSPCSGIAKKKDCLKLDECRMDTVCGCIPKQCVCSDFQCIFGQPKSDGASETRSRRLLSVDGALETSVVRQRQAKLARHSMVMKQGFAGVRLAEMEVSNETGVEGANETGVEDKAAVEPVMRPQECCASQKFRQEYTGRTWRGVRAFEIDLTQSQGNEGIAAIDTNSDVSKLASITHLTMGKGHELGRNSG